MTFCFTSSWLTKTRGRSRGVPFMPGGPPPPSVGTRGRFLGPQAWSAPPKPQVLAPNVPVARPEPRFAGVERSFLDPKRPFLHRKPPFADPKRQFPGAEGRFLVRSGRFFLPSPGPPARREDRWPRSPCLPGQRDDLSPRRSAHNWRRGSRLGILVSGGPACTSASSAVCWKEHSEAVISAGPPSSRMSPAKLASVQGNPRSSLSRNARQPPIH